MAGGYRILLFDIDGTLVSTGGAGAVAWKQAFQELHGAGCTAIGVATGHHDGAGRREAGADHVLPALEEELPLR